MELAMDLIGFDRLAEGPFHWHQAQEWGITRRQLDRWLELRVIKRVLRGAYHDVRLPETLGLRADCLRLVVPPDAVITDRSAAWLHGAPGALAPNS
ncbi:MAG: hypothetical protein ACRCYQ_01350, partial [Nocardioides sp.]